MADWILIAMLTGAVAEVCSASDERAEGAHRTQTGGSELAADR